MNYLLLESGDRLLLEDGSGILTENQPVVFTVALTMGSTVNADRPMSALLPMSFYFAASAFADSVVSAELPVVVSLTADLTPMNQWVIQPVTPDEWEAAGNNTPNWTPVSRTNWN